jgi:hypothetical protein
MYRLPPAASGPGFRALLDYWIARFPTDAAAGSLPGRQHIDPAELPPRYLAHLLLLQVVPGSPRRYRFRVAGTAFSSIAGRDVTGLHYDEIGTAEQVAPVLAAFDLMVDRAAPVFLEGALSFPPDDHFWVQRLGLPLAQDGCNVDLVLALWVARRQSRADLAKAAAAAGADGVRPQLLERI